ncbi:ankyrin repeat and MYND domain-containing protein 2-like [Microcaecilia unicolor]|uniref:Ankyrin repeat and MYND domain-containing protein 2-like n=1 Tax=Microcaecilia unicolor TaxID=1415580 RepID=A0A6P7Y3X4_9AMPH|nr:ankyrin repeat and MYND domain-containing protein 2-like [Microcaecilia unicolor]
MARASKGELHNEEYELLEVIGTGNVQKAGLLLGSKNVRVNCLDEHGMTPLMHAAYKGKASLCRLLLQHGADVNCNEHEHGYTALMFAGLSEMKKPAHRLVSQMFVASKLVLAAAWRSPTSVVFERFLLKLDYIHLMSN